MVLKDEGKTRCEVALLSSRCRYSLRCVTRDRLVHPRLQRWQLTGLHVSMERNGSNDALRSLPRVRRYRALRITTHLPDHCRLDGGLRKRRDECLAPRRVDQVEHLLLMRDRKIEHELRMLIGRR